MNFGKFKNFAEGAAKVAGEAYQSYKSQEGNRADPTTGSDAAPATAAPDLDDGSNVPLSECNGNKKSLFIGINYVGSSAELRGCINDVINIKQFVVDNYKFPTDADHMKTLVDNDDANMPTRENILKAFQWLVDGAQPGDSLFLHYSGTTRAL
jgi:Caspase domain